MKEDSISRRRWIRYFEFLALPAALAFVAVWFAAVVGWLYLVALTAGWIYSNAKGPLGAILAIMAGFTLAVAPLYVIAAILERRKRG